MLNTYIKNRGITQTIIHNKNQNHFNEINWDADYDGKLANISINSNNDGLRDQLNFTLDNNDLANILNIQSIDTPLDERLMMDFNDQSYYIDTPLKHTKSHISSPSINEEFIIPVTIDRKSINKFKKHHRRHKSHKTHKVYKKPKSISKSRISRSKSRRSKSSPLISLL